MKIYYRISDNSYDKQKIPGVTKDICLRNFLKTFKDVIFSKEVMDGEEKPPVTIIADRCSEETLKIVKETGLPMVETDLGNAASMHYALDLAAAECRDEELAYFVEDDYLHLGNAPILLREGMLHSEYITLYDHPDKYTNMYNMGETSQVVRTNSTHWRYTVSTCMTFAVKVGTLKEDIEIFKKHRADVSDDAPLMKSKDGDHPMDHAIFTELKEKGRRLTVCIPGAACHTDLTFSGLANRLLIEPWAIETMVLELQECLSDVENRIKEEDKDRFADIKGSLLNGKEGWDLLMGLHALLNMCE